MLSLRVMSSVLLVCLAFIRDKCWCHRDRTVVAHKAQHLITKQYSLPIFERKHHQPTGPTQSPESTKSSAGIGPFGCLCKAPLIYGGFLRQSSSEHTKSTSHAQSPHSSVEMLNPTTVPPQNLPNVMALATHGWKAPLTIQEISCFS